VNEMAILSTFGFKFQVSGFKKSSQPMRPPETRNPKPETHARLRRAFSFAEILFAVMILGIGFIMVAAMFPVAIKQTQLTGQESNAATLASEAANMIEKFSTMRLQPSGTIMPSGYGRHYSNKPPDSTYPWPLSPAANIPAGSTVRRGRVYSFRDDRYMDTRLYPNGPLVDPNATWSVVSGNLVSVSDPRLAWIPLYRRDQVWDPSAFNPVTNGLGDWVESPFAEIILFAVQVRNHSAYSMANTTAATLADRMAPDLRRFASPNFLPSPPKTDFLVAASGNITNPPPAVLEPALYSATIRLPATAGAPQQIQFYTYTASNFTASLYSPYAYPPLANGRSSEDGRLAEGCYVVISDDGQTGTISGQTGALNGAILRLGRQPDPNVMIFEVAPGSELFANSIPATGLSCLVFVVGRGYRYVPADGNVPAHADPAAGYDGAPQDIAVYASYVRVK